MDILPTLNIAYDLTLLVDVLEHFTSENGKKLVDIILSHSKNVLISTPFDIGDQDDHFGNVFETHHFQWKKDHFAKYKDKFFIHNRRSLICYIGEDAKRLKHSRTSRVRTAIRTLLFG